MRPLLILLLISFSHISFAQDSMILNKVVKPQPVVDNRAFYVIDQMPEYPGGEYAMMQFIRDNLVYPNYDVQGRVVVGFVVNEDGSLSDIVIKRGISKDIDAEAIRVVKLFPKFVPGKQRGKPVKAEYVVPIMFKLL